MASPRAPTAAVEFKELTNVRVGGASGGKASASAANAPAGYEGATRRTSRTNKANVSGRAQHSADSADSALGDWPEPIPLTRTVKLPEFPVTSLSDWLGKFVVALAEELQAPVDLVAVLALAALASLLHKRVKVQVEGKWIETVNLYIVIALRSGEMKSPAFRRVVAPLREVERALQADWWDLKQQRGPLLEAARKEYKAATKAVSVDDPASVERLALAAKSLEELEIPPMPRLFADDITQEALGMLLEAQRGKISILSAEGGIFHILAGHYTEGRANVEILLKGYDGEPVHVDRVGRPSIFLPEPIITVGLAVQPGVIEGLSGTREFRDRGFLARFMYALPSTRVGSRDKRPTQMVAAVEAEFNLRMIEIGTKAQTTNDADLIRLSPEAREELRRFEVELESRLGSGKELDDIADWVNKLAGRTARIAALLTVARNGTIAPIVDVATMRQAIQIGRYTIPHALAAFDLMGADEALNDARRILALLKEQRISEASVRDVYNKLRSMKPVRCNAALAILEEHGYIRFRKVPAKPRGRPPSPTFEVTPWL
jgi:replicative DNA helicase